MRPRPPFPMADPSGAADAVCALDRRRAALLRLPTHRAGAMRRDALAPARKAAG